MVKRSRDQAEDDDWPEESHRDDRVADGCEPYEEEEGTAASIVVRDPPAWVLVDPVQKIFGGAIGTDRYNRGAECLQVFREKPPPHLLAQCHCEHRGGDGRDVAFKPQPGGKARPSARGWRLSRPFA
jgi:hypothetical protein